MPKRHPYLNLLVTIWQFAKGKRGKLILIYSMSIIANLIIMMEPYFLGKFLNVIQAGGDDVLFRAGVVLAIYVSLSALFWAFHGPSRCMERQLAFHVHTSFARRMFEIVTKLPLQWHRDNHSGQTIDKIGKAQRALMRFVDEGYVYIQSLIAFVMSLTAVFLIMRWSGLWIVFFGAIAVFIILRFDKVLTSTWREINRREHRVAAVFFDYVSNMSTIITLRLGRLARNEYVKKMRRVFPVLRRNIRANEGKWVVVDLVMMVTFFTVVMMYLTQDYRADGVIMVGTLVMLYEYVTRFIEVFYGLAWKYEKLVMTSTDLTAVSGILEDYDKLYSGKRVRPVSKDWRKIEIERLDFKYEDEKHRVHALKRIEIMLKRGQKIALVGESGGGKSTLMAVLRGLSVADQIEMKVDERAVGDLRALAEVTTLIPQDPEIFENTIEYNITMGIAHEQREVMRAVRLACFEKVLKKLPNGLKTNIREKGVNLSGGEKQRLALARGIFASQGSSLVLLDEPTSSVDSTNELAIYKNLLRYFNDRCLVSTVHRLHLLRLFDYIYVINSGRVVEKGTFKKLLAKEGGYLKKQWGDYKMGD